MQYTTGYQSVRNFSITLVNVLPLLASHLLHAQSLNVPKPVSTQRIISSVRLNRLVDWFKCSRPIVRTTTSNRPEASCDTATAAGKYYLEDTCRVRRSRIRQDCGVIQTACETLYAVLTPALSG